MRKLITVGSVAAVLLFTGCTGDIAKMASSGLGQQLAQTASSSATTQAATTKAAAGVATASKANCIPRMSGGQTSMFDLIKEKAITFAIEQSIKSIDGMEDIKFPTKIVDTCEADARLKYVEDISNKYFENLNLVNTKILEALEETKEVNQIKADLEDLKNIEDKADLNEGIAENAEKIHEIMETAKVKDSKKISEAQGIFFKSMPKYTALLIGWDKEIADFAKDNLPWAINNFGAVKTAITQMKTVATLAVNGKTTMEKFIESNNIKIDTRARDRAANAMIKTDKIVLAKSEKEFDSSFN